MVAGSIDVLVVTASANELSAVLALGPEGEHGWKETVDRSGSTYHVREFTTEAGEPFRVAAAWSGRAGVEGVTLRTTRLVQELAPSYLATSGICTGNPGRVRVGDVVVANQVFAFRYHFDEDINGNLRSDEVNITSLQSFNLGKNWITEAAYKARTLSLSNELLANRPISMEAQKRWLLHAIYDHEMKIGPAPVAHPERRRLCPDWAQVIKELRREHWGYRDTGDLEDLPGQLVLSKSGKRKVADERLFHPEGLPPDPAPQIYTGLIGSSTVPVEYRSVFAALEEQEEVDPILAVDTESAALAEIARQSDRHLMIVKTVVDLVGDDKNDRMHAWGARAAAETLLSLLRKVIRPIQRLPIGDAAAYRDVSIDQITIHNFKNIQHLEIPFAAPSELSGHWTCIAGINGAGKTAILQAVVLVLLGQRLPINIGGEWLKRAQRTENGEPQTASIRARVRWGEEMLDLALPLGGSHGIDDRRLEAEEPHLKKMQAFWDAREQGHLLLSYGAGRNLSRRPQEGDRDKDVEVRRQMTLFDPMTQVEAADVLLKQSESSKPILAMLKRLLEPLLHDTEFALDTEHEKLRFRVGASSVDATELPDGFRATVTWLADLCATWFAKAGDEAKNDADPSKIRGIVLVDEIDLYLHASLQRTIVPRLRKALPLVQWIVTTHSPLVVSSFDRREIVLLELGEQGPQRRMLDRQILGFSSDEVYEYLMGIPPRSSALDEPLEGDRAGARRVEILAQSPEVNEEQAKDNEAWLDDLAKEMEARRATGARE